MSTTTTEVAAQSAKRSLHLILNNQAACDLVLREMIQAARARGHRIEVRVVWEPGDAERFASEAADEFDCVVAAGGDGTINEVVNGMFKVADPPSCALGILPYGTANDFAKGCGVSLDVPAHALDLVTEAAPVPIDVGRVNGRLFLNAATGGFGAEVTTETSPEAKQFLGKFAYFLTGLATVTSLMAHDAQLRAPDFEWEGPLFGISIANGRQAGGGFQVGPRALLDDGLLDVMAIPEVPWSDFLSLINDVMTIGQGFESEHVIYRQVPWLEIDSPEGLQVNLDGEPLRGTNFRFEIFPQRLLCHLTPDAATVRRVGRSGNSAVPPGAAD